MPEFVRALGVRRGECWNKNEKGKDLLLKLMVLESGSTDTFALYVTSMPCFCSCCSSIQLKAAQGDRRSPSHTTYTLAVALPFLRPFPSTMSLTQSIRQFSQPKCGSRGTQNTTFPPACALTLARFSNPQSVQMCWCTVGSHCGGCLQSLPVPAQTRCRYPSSRPLLSDTVHLWGSMRETLTPVSISLCWWLCWSTGTSGEVRVAKLGYKIEGCYSMVRHLMRGVLQWESRRATRFA